MHANRMGGTARQTKDPQKCQVLTSRRIKEQKFWYGLAIIDFCLVLCVLPFQGSNFWGSCTLRSSSHVLLNFLIDIDISISSDDKSRAAARRQSSGWKQLFLFCGATSAFSEVKCQGRGSVPWYNLSETYELWIASPEALPLAAAHP